MKNRGVFFGLVFVVSGMSFDGIRAVDLLQANVNEALDAQKLLVSPLGKNKTARVGALASLGFLTALGSFLTYKTCEQIFDAGLGYVPFLRSYHEKTAKIAALTVAFPVSIVAFMKYGFLTHYFFYILYAGERVSPLLARDALHDVRVYVEHLQTIKSVQKELYEVIDQINALSSQKDSQKKDRTPIVEAHILMQLDQAIKHDDEYLQSVLTQLQLFLSPQELDQFVQELSSYKYHKGYCIAPELQGHTQAIITQLQSTVQCLGDDVLVLNNLMMGLVDYWQKYTMALAEGIDASLRFCNEVHTLEQVITKWLDRSLLCA